MSPKGKKASKSQVDDRTDEALEALMSGSDVVDLDSTAEEAARQVAGETEPDYEDEVTDEVAHEASTSITIDRVLQVLLACNLALIGVLVMLPGTSPPPEPAQSKRPAFIGEQSTEPRPDPFVQPPRNLGALPESQLWENAVRAAGQGDYARAVQLLEHHVTKTQSMTDVERRLVYNQLSYYLVKDGRIDEAQRYERMSNQIMTRSYLPEDLLNSAHRAAEQGQLAEMRTAYARFLLQQKQVPPSLRKHIAEAYLKLGDSYRLEAGRAADRAESHVLPQTHRQPDPEEHK